jgi:hypothetical protein
VKACRDRHGKLAAVKISHPTKDHAEVHVDLIRLKFSTAPDARFCADR